jgi:hypothetical protein
MDVELARTAAVQSVLKREVEAELAYVPDHRLQGSRLQAR